MIKSTILLISLLLISEYGFSEDRKIIVVIDSGIHKSQLDESFVCQLPHISVLESEPAVIKDTTIWFNVLNGTEDIYGKNIINLNNRMTWVNLLYNTQDAHQIHGENVINIIGSKIDDRKYCVLSIRYASSATNSNYEKAITLVGDMENIAAVNLSVTGPEESEVETAAITKLIKRGTKIICAAGNKHKKLTKKNCSAYPACLKAKTLFLINKNFIVVGNHDTDSSNSSELFEIIYRPGLDQGHPAMTGTSQSTANYTGELFNGKKRKELIKRVK